MAMRSLNEARQSIDFGVGPTRRGANCGEVGLGLLATFSASLALWVITVPFFDVIGIAWIKTWPNRFPPPISLSTFKERMRAVYSNPVAAFEAMDVNRDEFADLAEFVSGARTFDPPLNKTEAKYAFLGLDQDGDGLLESMEFASALAFGTSSTISTDTAGRNSDGASSSLSLSFPERVKEEASSHARTLWNDVQRGGSQQRLARSAAATLTTELACRCAREQGGLAGRKVDEL
eukprot:CAMPEP_0113824180 /NCGR_PEP_ID=MMETSP0328-20130328/3114_1 /TAXON_ID=39455 /ORGANISM="Alexandrium minutum" /LENGTH=233 /DNA_ID=CAMNT_0000792121 /DNA_START=27 /DNA_END=726 /DNA_ORIENTATION=- /assembly_acc=CAM_ASM_000350